MLYLPVNYNAHLIGRSISSAYERNLGQRENFFEEFIGSALDILPQSSSETNGDVLSGGQEGNSEVETANMQFHDVDPGQTYDRSGSQITTQDELDYDLGNLKNFLSRPVLIQTLEWPVNTDFFTTINPWQLFFENRRNINRISNYKLLKARLHVKIVVSGTYMHYGRLLVSYLPLHVFDSRAETAAGVLPAVLMSQRPHIYVNPTISEGGTLCLPFFHPETMLDIPTGQWREMGELNFSSLGFNLKHANGATSPVSISVFAWADEVVLSGLTQQNAFGIGPQAAAEELGIVSKPASAIARVASSLSELPTIGKYMRATEIGANSIAKMATFFGFSKPVTTEVNLVQNLGVDNIATCDGKDNTFKLTFDSRQEVSVDPSITGISSHDELVIQSIATRESILGTTIWPTSSDPGARLQSFVVCPSITRNVSSAALTNKIYMPACAFASNPFQFWRGTMRYRFQVVGSMFHKGRLRIVWDPHGVPTGPIESNTAYSYIVDISEKNDFTIDIGWGQTTPYRTIMSPFQPPELTYAAGGLLTYDSSNLAHYGNGTVSVYVLNRLVSSNTSINNDIHIITSICATDDFEVAVPKDYSFGLMLRPPNSATGTVLEAPILTTPGLVPSGSTLASAMALVPSILEAISEEEIVEDIKPQAYSEIIDHRVPVQQEDAPTLLGPPLTKDPALTRIHFGETISSFRQLMKRYGYHEALAFSGSQILRRISFIRKNFPYYGEFTTAIPNTNNNIIESTPVGNYHIACMAVLQYVTCAFAGYRGGFRYMVDISNSYQGIGTEAFANQSDCHINVNTLYPLTRNAIRERNQTTAMQALGGSNLNRRAVSAFQTVNANLVFATRANNIIKFEVPYQVPWRFTPARYGNDTTLGNGDNFTNPYDGFFEIETVNVLSSGTLLWHKYVAAAEDYTPVFYIGPPVFYHKNAVLT